jgi:uncharacterized membrane protein YjjP (DUF1212 family)
MKLLQSGTYMVEVEKYLPSLGTHIGLHCAVLVCPNLVTYLVSELSMAYDTRILGCKCI